MEDGKIAVIIGAGPAGLTAAHELLARSGIKPIVLEMTGDIGGISKTVTYHGNHMDMGGHRFFSKSDRIMNWWLGIMPMQASPARDELLLHPEAVATAGNAPDPERTDTVMLLRRRFSRIFYLRKFFDYPITLSKTTLGNLGLLRAFHIGLSYGVRRLFPIKEEKSLEDFFINRFGDTLYRLFFEDYTEKVWGVKPSRIKPDWGAQRVKGLSIAKVILHALSHLRNGGKSSRLAQKDVETSLIERFLYPKFGPGQLWERVADQVRQGGGEIRTQQRLVGLTVREGRVVAAAVQDTRTGETSTLAGDYFFSSMPVSELIAAMGEAAPVPVRQVASGLVYRDFITVGILVKRLRVANRTAVPTVGNIIPDLWIYIQERDVKVGRIQIFNNWSPYLVRDPETVWIGLEYFASQGDALDTMPEQDMKAFAVAELVKLGLVDAADVLDTTVARMPKAYPAYFGTYDRFDRIRDFTDTLANLFLIGRNGQHRYNNMDHSMLTAMEAVDNILAGKTSKDNIWAVNTEQEYLEEKE